MKTKRAKPIPVPLDDADLDAIEEDVGNGGYLRETEAIILKLTGELRLRRRRLRTLDPPVVWHWSYRVDEHSGCPRSRAGDMSTDSRPQKVTCPRCMKLRTRLESLARLGES